MSSVTRGMRYSQGKKDTMEAHNSPVRNFLENFPAEDTAELTIDPDSALEARQKVKLLFNLLQDKPAKADAASKPHSLIASDFAIWEKIHFEIASYEIHPAKATLRMLIERRKDMNNLSLEYKLCGLPMDHGEYEEMTEKLPGIIEWENGLLGKGSPGALSTRRALAEAIWRHGRKADAETLLREILELAGSMAKDP
ncbi:hypothetical protein F5Y03DRAFT_403376 [Xylaria venustula]|nr:hypothetical protein F5Y03DRAFT_403376 [Xylaria venustula]